MLIITVEADTTIVRFRLDGRLAGAGVRELARHWSAAVFNQPQKRVLVDLTGVSSVDVLGKQFLAEVHRHGDSLVGGAATKGVVDEISNRPVPMDPSCLGTAAIQKEDE